MNHDSTLSAKHQRVAWARSTAQMVRIDHEGRAICGTYPYEEAEKKVADVLAFAGEHKHPLQCVLERAN
jgi:ATP-dependent Clp protease adaptor protein ClpS